MRTVTLVLALIVAAVLAGAPAADRAGAQAGTIRIGLLFDHTGPFSAAGSLANWRGARLAIDAVNDRGGVLGRYPIVRIDADSQSKAEVALNEAERLLAVEKVDILAGIFSSAHAVPLAEKVDRQTKFLWITTAISDAVFRGRDLHYVFRPQPSSDMFGALSVQYLAAYAADRLKKAPTDLRVAIIYEDGPYGTGVARSNDAEARRRGMTVVLKEGYSAAAPDLSPLVTKLRSVRPDVLLHTGYNPDIALFLRQARELGFRVKAMIGHGAGHSQLDKLKEAFGPDVEGIHTVDPVAAQLLNPGRLRPGVGEATQEMIRRYRTEFGPGEVPLHVSIGFNNVWILLTDVLPRAIQKYGGFDAERLARAARETDIPEGGTLQGYGVKFYPPGHEMAGQNARAFPAVYQVIGGRFEVVYPKSVATATPVLPLPASSPFAAR